MIDESLAKRLYLMWEDAILNNKHDVKMAIEILMKRYYSPDDKNERRQK